MQMASIFQRNDRLFRSRIVILQYQNKIRGFRCQNGPPYTFLFDHILRLPNSGRIEYADQVTIEININAQHVSGRTSNVSDNSNVTAAQSIKKRGLASVRLSHQRHLEPVTNYLTASAVLEMAVDFTMKLHHRVPHLRGN
ncbi:hypothetical protein D3C80_1410920 [compost metagenome]